jgi:molybdopterin/thiamine biosynthesis adenylyltransferase
MNMETETEMIFDRQHQIFNPKEQKTRIIVVGCGSVGSLTILTLAKLGFKQIVAIDYDVVEPVNIPNQFYRFSDISKLKVEAIKDIVKDFTGTEIAIINRKIDEENKFIDIVGIDLNTIVVFALDNIESRALIYNELKDIPSMKIIDVRVGGQGSNIYFIDLENKSDKKKYETLLEQPTNDDACGNKFVIYNLLYVASETCNIIKRLDKGEKIPSMLMREMSGYRILTDFYN